MPYRRYIILKIQFSDCNVNLIINFVGRYHITIRLPSEMTGERTKNHWYHHLYPYSLNYCMGVKNTSEP